MRDARSLSHARTEKVGGLPLAMFRSFVEFFLRVRGKKMHRRVLVSRLDSAVPERTLCQNSTNVIHVADDGALCPRLAWLKADWSSCACFSSSGLSTPTTFARSWSSRPFSVAMKFISVHCFFFSRTSGSMESSVQVTFFTIYTTTQPAATHGVLIARP